jgi:hemoglobin-like flavoprotein
MKTSISKQSAAIVVDSLPAIVARRRPFEEAMAKHMARRGPFDPSRDRYRVTAASIADMLLDHAGGITAQGEISIIPHHAERHQRMAIGGEHYSAFGDGLAAILSDVVPAQASPGFLAAWGDTYWAVTRMIMAQAMPAAA